MVAIEIGESTADDLKFILSWLEAEEDDTSNGFWCNRGIVEDSHAEGGMLVLREDGVAVAFQLGALVRPGIMEVRRSEEHTSELPSLMRLSYAVFCLKQK